MNQIRYQQTSTEHFAQADCIAANHPTLLYTVQNAILLHVLLLGHIACMAQIVIATNIIPEVLQLMHLFLLLSLSIALTHSQKP